MSTKLETALAKMESLPTTEEVKVNPELLTPEVIETVNSMIEAIHEVVEAITRWIAIHAQEIFDRLSVWAASFHDWTYALYLEQGAKYGETEKGFQRWLDDKNKPRYKKKRIRTLSRRHFTV